MVNRAVGLQRQLGSSYLVVHILSFLSVGKDTKKGLWFSGTYTYSHLDNNGCTQVDTLHLTINHPVHQAITAVNITVTAENPNTVVADYDKFVENHRAKEISSQDDTVLYLTAFPLYDPVYYSIWFDMRSPEHSWIDIGYHFLNVILVYGDTLEIVFAENGHEVLLRIEHAYGGYTLYSGLLSYYT